MDDDPWDKSLSALRDLSHIPGAGENADLLEQARPTWEKRVVPRTSMFDLLFTRPEDEFPWDESVRVTRTDTGAIEFQLLRDGHLITADRATAENAPAVLDAFLMQLTGTYARGSFRNTGPVRGPLASMGDKSLRLVV